MHVAFRVQHYDEWKAGYDASVEHRRAAGGVSYEVLRDPKDSTLITVVSTQGSAECAQAFLDSPGLNIAHRRAKALAAACDRSLRP